MLVDTANEKEMAEAAWISQRVVERAIAMEGTCTGEHGIGQGKMPFLEAELGDALDLMRELGSAEDRSDLSYMHQPSISEHPQNRDFHDWTALIDLTLAEGADPVATLHDLKHITDQLLVRNPSYRCTRCGFGARTHHWQCPSCKEWGTIKPLLNYAVV